MKYIRILTVFLLMTLAISPVLAANCAATCASKTVMSTISNGNDADMSTMMHCHENLTSKPAADNHHSDSHHDKSDASHKSCPMGVGCHFAQATPTNTNIKHVLVTVSVVSFPSFDSTEKSVDLSPPLKPPA